MAELLVVKHLAFRALKRAYNTDSIPLDDESTFHPIDIQVKSTFNTKRC